MNAAIYDIATGRIKRFVDVIASQLDIQLMEDGEDFYLNLSLGDATHIINSESVSIPVVRPDDSMEVKMMRIRMHRDALLRDTDIKYCNPERWADMPAEKQLQWRVYKQELRDLPAGCDPDNPVWPLRPI